MDEDYKYYIKLCAIPEIGAVSAMRLLKYFGSPQAALSASKSELMKVEKIGEKTANSIIANRDKIDVEKIRARMDAVGARYIHFNDPRYPALLRKIPDPPVGFYIIGDCDFSAPCISIIGSRNCSVYGQITARKFAASFARAGFTVVSGMARGIDSCAHYGALEAKGKTVAVLGCGADVLYPPENGDLYNRLVSHGAIVSEFPLGTRADRQNFPIRNRIVAGLSVATLVVESDIKGGSMITARLAGEQGRDVFAIPGRIDQSTSRGCNALIRDGVRLATCPEDIIDELAFSNQLSFDLKSKSAPEPAKTEEPECPQIRLSGDEAEVFKCFESVENLDADTAASLSGLSVQRCLSALLMLEIKKAVVKKAGGIWTKRG